MISVDQNSFSVTFLNIPSPSPPTERRVLTIQLVLLNCLYLGLCQNMMFSPDPHPPAVPRPTQLRFWWVSAPKQPDVSTRFLRAAGILLPRRPTLKTDPESGSLFVCLKTIKIITNRTISNQQHSSRDHKTQRSQPQEHAGKRL